MTAIVVDDNVESSNDDDAVAAFANLARQHDWDGIVRLAEQNLKRRRALERLCSALEDDQISNAESILTSISPPVESEDKTLISRLVGTIVEALSLGIVQNPSPFLHGLLERIPALSRVQDPRLDRYYLFHNTVCDDGNAAPAVDVVVESVSDDAAASFASDEHRRQALTRIVSLTKRRLKRRRAFERLRSALDHWGIDDAEAILMTITPPLEREEMTQETPIARLVEVIDETFEENGRWLSDDPTPFFLCLLERIPAVARVRHPDYGAYLLHTLCEHYHSVEPLQLLLKLNPEACRHRDRFGSLPFHYLFFGYPPSLEVVKLVLHHNPDAIRQPLTNEDYEDEEDTNELPLHLALGGHQDCGSSSELIGLLINAFPDGLERANKNGEIPLHTACDSCGPSASIVALLVNAFPAGVEYKTKAGDTPLHLACLRNASYEIIKLLADACPKGVKARNVLGCLPLHNLVGKTKDNASLQAMELLIKRYPDSIRSQDQNGRIPLHLAALKSSAETLQALLDRYPEGVHVTDKRGRIPLHYASFAHTAMLFKQDVIFEDSNNFDCRQSNLDHVVMLVQADPYSVLRVSHDGTWPYQLALQRRERAYVYGDVEDDDAAVSEFLLNKTADAVNAVKEAFVDVAHDGLGLPDLVVAKIWSFANHFDSFACGPNDALRGMSNLWGVAEEARHRIAS